MIYHVIVLGGMMSLAVKSKTKDVVKCVVVDGGELKSRRHLNVRGKSATLPSITGIFSVNGVYTITIFHFVFTIPRRHITSI